MKVIQPAAERETFSFIFLIRHELMMSIKKSSLLHKDDWSSSASELQQTRYVTLVVNFILKKRRRNPAQSNSLEVDKDVFLGLLLFAENPGPAADAVVDVVEAHRSPTAFFLHTIFLFVAWHPVRKNK